MTTSVDQTIGFIGLGVMGEPMCRNIVQKSGRPVVAFDINPAPLDRLATHGVARAGSAAEVAGKAGTVLLSLPGGKELAALCQGPSGLIAAMRKGQTLVDLGTSGVPLTRELAAVSAAKGIDYADAPVARTRQAAEDGTLAITVGATPELFARLKPLLMCCASEVTHCGSVGAGQVVKILNNMVVVETVVAISEAAAIAREAGVDPKLLFDALSKGSADSFALRNHGMKAVIPGQFPERAFSVEYMLKDVTYALELAGSGGIDAKGATLGRDLLVKAREAGYGAQYWPVISKLMKG